MVGADAVTLTSENLLHVPGLLSRWVMLPTGVRAHYVTAGEAGPDVVLLHGGIIGSSGTAGWRFMAPFLGAAGFRVHCPDMPAFGFTVDDRGAYAHGEAGLVDFLHDFTTVLGLTRFHLGGNSLGCAVAVDYAVAHPERVRSLALIAGVIGDLLPMLEMRALDTRSVEERPLTSQRFDGSAESMRGIMTAIIQDASRIDEDMVAMRTYAANLQREAYATFRARLEAAYRGEDPDLAARMSTRGRFDRLTIPAIYLYGRDDVLFPVQMGYAQEDLLPNVQFFYPSETGHQGQTDSPELFNLVFLEFFRDGRVSWESAVRAGISERRPPIAQLVSSIEPK